MTSLSTACRVCSLLSFTLVASSGPADAAAIQLFSPAQLGPHTVTVLHTSTDDLLSSPHVVPTPDGNALTFILAMGDWRRLDEGANVLSNFSPGTGLLYTNNNNGVGLSGQGHVGGGGSGPVDILFAVGVRGVGFSAQTEVIGPETVTVSAFDDLTLLGTFSVSGINAQRQDGSALFLGVLATADDLITRIVVSSVTTQGGVDHANRFFFGPVTYKAVPEPSVIALMSLAVLAGIRRLSIVRGARMR